jgi:hypothetical protein
MIKKKKRDARDLKTLDDYLDDEGTRREFEATAVQEVAIWLTERSKPSSDKHKKRD